MEKEVEEETIEKWSGVCVCVCVCVCVPMIGQKTQRNYIRGHD